MSFPEYLVSYGAEVFISRFAPVSPLHCQRGEQVIVRSHRGLELGTVLCESGPAHAQCLHSTSVGELLRRATPEDEALEPFSALGIRVFDEARRLVRERQLSLDIVDVEVLLEPRTLIVHYLRTGKWNLRPLVEALGRRFEALVELKDLALGIATEYGDHHQERVCHSNGGCGSGGCGAKPATPVETRSFLVELRSKLTSRFG
jgi:cell fate regulator YaaT (PSP1 superfamily)